MTNGRYRVLLIYSHPVQYASHLFRRMVQHPRLDIQVVYCSLQGTAGGLDSEFGTEVTWDVPLLEGYPWRQIPNRSPQPGLGRFFGLVNPGLWKVVRNGEFDAVAIHTGYAYASFWIVAAAAKLSGTPILFGTDATTLRSRGAQRWKVPFKSVLLPAIFRLADVVLAPSAATAEFFRSMRIPDRRIALTPFVVENDWWTREAARFDRVGARLRWRLPETASVVLFCAKFQPWKRPHDLLRAFARARLSGAVLVMAGEGPLRGELEAEAKALGMSDRVRFPGFVNQTQLPSLYRSADLMVLPSESDACPVAVCEAMLCGYPVVISDEIRGRFDIVHQGQTGFIYPCRDVDALAEILTMALTDRKKLAEMSAAARARMETWSPEANVEALVDGIQTAVALRGSGNHQ
jgi:glycosyltransferase involved in cell wall biosynthesis